MKFTAKPARIEGYEILEVAHLVQTGVRRTYLSLRDKEGRISLTKDFLTLFSPKRGDFLVIYDNGDHYILPPDVFHARFQEVHGISTQPIG